MDRLAKLAFVVSQLDSYAGEKKVLNGSTLVSCPFHSERTPSFRVFHSPSTRSPGYGKCYGCGATASWDELAPKIGLAPIKAAKPTPLYANSLRRDLATADQTKEDLVLSDLPRDKVWRSISTNLLIDIGAKKARTSWDAVFVYLPVMVLGRLRGYIKARLRKEEGKISYLNSKGTWSANSGLFLYDYVIERFGRFLVVLVEGPRDALRLCSLGIPAVAILGTQSWSDKKSRLIELAGFEHVILLTDGDCAGLSAFNMISPKLEPYVKVHPFSLTGRDSPYWAFRHEDEPTKAAKANGVELWDPGNMPTKKVRQLKQLIDELSQTKLNSK